MAKDVMPRWEVTSDMNRCSGEAQDGRQRVLVQLRGNVPLPRFKQADCDYGTPKLLHRQPLIYTNRSDHLLSRQDSSNLLFTN